jgi:hypothetical protein
MPGLSRNRSHITHLSGRYADQQPGDEMTGDYSRDG